AERRQYVYVAREATKVAKEDNGDDLAVLLGQLSISIVGSIELNALVANIGKLKVSTAREGVVKLSEAMADLTVGKGKEVKPQQATALSLLDDAFGRFDIGLKMEHSVDNEVKVCLEPGETWEGGVSRIAEAWLAEDWPETAVVPDGGSTPDQLRAKASAELQYSRNMTDEAAEEEMARGQER
ncbi:unnamed protein product, partial [Ectocarpus fasciculatus]